MPRQKHNKLTVVAVNAKKEPGYYSDGNGLYLQVSPSGSKSWVFRFALNKRKREMGLGSIATYSLSEARERAKKCRQLLDEGLDPIESRKSEREKNIQATAAVRTFEECAHEYHSLHLSTWKNAKHADQWINTLSTYAFPLFGKKNISNVSKTDVVSALEPIWIKKAETASRVRQRIRAVLDWAAARDYRVNHDPHMWDQITRALPKTTDVKKQAHFAACPYSEISSVITMVTQSNASDITKAALSFLILTAARSGEVRGATWSEIDLQEARWVIEVA